MVVYSSLPVSLHSLVLRMLPVRNEDPADRIRAWNEWLSFGGSDPVLKFIRWSNGTTTDDEEILQETLILGYLKVERGEYQDRNLPFTAFLEEDRVVQDHGSIAQTRGASTARRLLRSARRRR
ncbi:MAG: hypothetical protein IPK17_02100 [Chloroflexi bacterium]|uniref:hypothetical protein n=1 Tax=Candidatus Flexifilum breve TaxID=3140694 RepID=UPI003136A780|nr:hypothetical protein [Chloroflexota bacterium]